MAHRDLNWLPGNWYRHWHHESEVFHIALKVIGHSDGSPITLMAQNHLGGFIEELGIGSGGIKAAESPSSASERGLAELLATGSSEPCRLVAFLDVHKSTGFRL